MRLQVHELQELHDKAMRSLKESVVKAIEQFAAGNLSPDGLLSELQDLGIDASVTLPTIAAGSSGDTNDALQGLEGTQASGVTASKPLPSARYCSGCGCGCPLPDHTTSYYLHLHLHKVCSCHSSCQSTFKTQVSMHLNHTCLDMSALCHVGRNGC